MESKIQMGCLFCFLTVRGLSTQENMSFISKCSMNCSWVGPCGWRPGRHLLCSHQSDLETPLLTSPTAWMWYYVLYCCHIVSNKCAVIQTAGQTGPGWHPEEDTWTWELCLVFPGSSPRVQWHRPLWVPVLAVRCAPWSVRLTGTVQYSEYNVR